jgi:eukaryotic-like serine/threonine-protein kinase
VTVPDEVGKTDKIAVLDLRRAGFASERTETESSQPAHTVVEQSPRGGALAPSGSTVTLTVSSGGGAKTATVPNVVGLTSDAAKIQLSAAGFGVTAKGQSTFKLSESGVVLDQSPAGGSTADPGSTVTITVGVFEGPR